MGCRTYEVAGGRIRFSEGDDEVSCLCTFPYSKGLDTETVRSLALLGAQVVLLAEERGGVAQTRYLPSGLPKWVVDGINRVLGQP